MASALRVLLLLCGLLAGAASDGSPKVDCCPDGWTRLIDRCYVVQTEPKNFVDAEKCCMEALGNLASVTSTLENVLVDQLVQEAGEDGALIGFHNAFEDGEFLWTDGTKFRFDNFEAGVTLLEDGCGFLTADTGVWSLVDCNTEEPFVCSTHVSCH
ncbi:snaclec agglucetin subunit alpha-2-like [Nerophis lumbriciformis]|uniref:snaclec agglucetin subunit alpha-2-like n=1 Tax=Nerophis lumbriciformis TaxID=546530 RepID=UPI002AE00879|nr:snaclec 4-like [Nerophis lumbriciformis]